MAEASKPPIAHLNASAVAKVESVERKLGDVYVLAYEKPLIPAELTPEQVKILQQAEHDLGVCLVAYQANA